MVDYIYSYLIGDVIVLILWLTLFLWRKDIRKEMLIISLLFGVLGPFIEAIYLIDWWKPLTITNTPIGIEDFLFGFGIGGIASVIYSNLFNRKVKIKKTKPSSKRNINLVVILSIFLGVFFGGSLYST